MKIDVDYNRCTGHGLCELEAADVFEVGKDGLVQVLIDHPGEEHRQGIEAAIEICPTAALSLRD
ncbi:MAG TPA: ferredoxin [Pseudonocardia sp.]|jgi:ferredoxin